MFVTVDRVILATISFMIDREENIGATDRWPAIWAMGFILGIDPNELIRAARAYRRYINAGGQNPEAVLNQLKVYLLR